MRVRDISIFPFPCPPSDGSSSQEAQGNDCRVTRCITSIDGEEGEVGRIVETNNVIESTPGGDVSFEGSKDTFLHVCPTTDCQKRLQNGSSNSLWVLERTHCVLGGQPLRPKTSTTYRRKACFPCTPGSHFSSDAVSAEADDRTQDHNDEREGGQELECVRVKHLATMSYLYIDHDYGIGPGEGPTSRPADKGGCRGGRVGDVRLESSPRVGTLKVERHAAVPASTMFIIRPRNAAVEVLGPEDLVHLQHKQTGLFLAAVPRKGVSEEGGKSLGTCSRGDHVGLTVVKAALTTEVGISGSRVLRYLYGA